MSSGFQTIRERIRGELGKLQAEGRAMLAARIELAKLELQYSIEQAKRLAIALLVAAVLLLVGVSLVAVLAANLLALWTILSFNASLAILGASFLLLGLLLSLLAWKRFQREFRGLEDSIGELKEDAAWLREWLEK